MEKDSQYNSYIPILLFLFAALVWRTSYYIYSLYVAIPVIITYCFYNYKEEIIHSKYFVPYLFVILWMFLSSFVNENTRQSFSMMIPILASFLFSMATYSMAYVNKYAYILFLTYVVLFAYMMVQNIGADSFTMNFDYANEIERGENSQQNANVYAYYSLFAIIGWRMFLLSLKNNIKPLFLSFFYLLSLIVVVFVALMTASRQVMALEIPLLLYFFYFDFVREKENKVILLLIIVVIIAISPYILDMYGNSYLATRSEVGFQDDGRSNLIKKAIEQGFDNPLYGIGLSANTSYSHCTYTHILSRTGFPAFVVFLYMILDSIIVQWRRFRETKDVIFLYYLGGLSIIGIGHFTYSYIQEPFMMAIMFAVVGLSDNMYSRDFEESIYDYEN